MKQYIFILVCLFTFSCLRTEGIEVEKRIESLYQVEDFNQEIIVNNDTLVVDELKFLVNDFILINEDSVLLEKSDGVPPLIHGYYENTSGNQLIFATPLGFDGLNNFKNYQHTVEGVDTQIPLNDPEFFEDGENYSTIIKGSFNNERFELFSTIRFTKKYFGDVAIELDDTNNTLLIQNTINITDIFVPSSDSLINPLDDSNLSIIQQRFRDNLNVQLSKGSSEILL